MIPLTSVHSNKFNSFELLKILSTIKLAFLLILSISLSLSFSIAHSVLTLSTTTLLIPPLASNSQ